MHFQEARIFRRVRADDIAEVAGVSCSTVSAWQQGSRVPNASQKRVIAEALALDPKQITYGPQPEGFTRRNIHPSKMRTLDEVAKIAASEGAETARVATKAKRAVAKAEVEAHTGPASESNGAVDIGDGTFEVAGRQDRSVPVPAPEAFDKGTWAVIRMMVEEIGTREAIRRLMLAK